MLLIEPVAGIIDRRSRYRVRSIGPVYNPGGSSINNTTEPTPFGRLTIRHDENDLRTFPLSLSSFLA